MKQNIFFKQLIIIFTVKDNPNMELGTIKQITLVMLLFDLCYAQGMLKHKEGRHRNKYTAT